MTGSIVFVIASVLVNHFGVAGASLTAQTQDDLKLAVILQRISKTTPERLAIIEKIQGMKPEINEKQSTKTLIDIVRGYVFDCREYCINPIGWEASEKKPFPGEPVSRWKITFHYQDHKREYQEAEWEFNSETDKLYPFEFRNARQFFAE